MTRRKTRYGLLLMLAIFGGASSGTGQEPRQYKRVHQQALKQIVNDRAQLAIENLQTFLEQFPEDAESYYMLTVAHARLGDKHRAVESMQRALSLGLPASRFVAGTLTGLESVRAEQVVKELSDALAHAPAHGPMLGNVSDQGISIWLRTVKQSTVQASAASTGAAPIWSQPVQSTPATDFTAVVRLQGLKPRTDYRYSIYIDGRETTKQNFKFRTIAAPRSPIRLRAAFGGGAGFVPENERVWQTIAATTPDVLLLLGDNVYSDDPTTPEMQHYCYYRRQARPEFRSLVASTPVFSIWDDHDFATNDSSGGPLIEQPAWKRPVFRVYRNNWVNPYYGGGDDQPGCYYDFYLGDVHFVMLDGRFYRNLKPEDRGRPTMLGPIQRAWLWETIKESEGKLLALCSPVPWVLEAKGDSRDTWNGFQDERNEIFDFLAERQLQGVLLISADRHRSDLWRIERRRGYPLYEFNSSRLTNQHVHKEMENALFSYNKKQSFGLLDFDTTRDDPTITYRIVTIDGDEVYSFTLKRSQLR